MSRGCAGALSADQKLRLLGKLARGVANECPVCMDVAQDAVVSLCAHGPFCRECITRCLSATTVSRL